MHWSGLLALRSAHQGAAHITWSKLMTVVSNIVWMMRKMLGSRSTIQRMAKMDNGEQRWPHIAAEMQDVGASDDHVAEITEQEVGAEAERRHAAIGLGASRAGEVQHILFHVRGRLVRRSASP